MIQVGILINHFHRSCLACSDVASNLNNPAAAAEPKDVKVEDAVMNATCAGGRWRIASVVGLAPCRSVSSSLPTSAYKPH